MTPEQRKENKLRADKAYKEANRARLNVKAKEYYQNKKDAVKAKYESNKEAELLKAKEYREANRATINEKQNKGRDVNKDTYKEYRKSYDKSYRENNKDKRNANQNLKRKTDPVFKLKEIVRHSIIKALKRNGYNKNTRTFDILGCSYNEFKEHIEKQFEPWMNWNNHGLYNGNFEYGWDIDHIQPICLATCETDIIRLNHFTNLQPLCSKTNRDIKKGATLPLSQVS